MTAKGKNIRSEKLLPLLVVLGAILLIGTLHCHKETEQIGIWKEKGTARLSLRSSAVQGSCCRGTDPLFPVTRQMPSRSVVVNLVCLAFQNRKSCFVFQCLAYQFPKLIRSPSVRLGTCTA